MEVVFLGTSSAVPTRTRNVTAVALRLPERGETWLFDCGEGTQHQLLRSPVSSGSFTRVFVTHLHGDHVFGLLGLLTSLSLAGALPALDLYGPEGLERFVSGAFEATGTHLAFPLRFHVARPGVVHEDRWHVVSCAPLRHVVPTFGYRVEERRQPGALDVERARALGVPHGPLLGRLKAGETVTLDDGRTVDGAELVGPSRPGRVFAFCTDTAFCDGAVELARGADLLVHEATYSTADRDRLPERGHATPAMAAEVARLAGARRLVLTHFSSRYGDVGPLLEEARAVFPETVAAEDLLAVPITRCAAAPP